MSSDFLWLPPPSKFPIPVLDDCQSVWINHSVIRSLSDYNYKVQFSGVIFYGTYVYNPLFGPVVKYILRLIVNRCFVPLCAIPSRWIQCVVWLCHYVLQYSQLEASFLHGMTQRLAWYGMAHGSLPALSAVLIQGLGDWGASVAIWGNNVISGRTELLNHSLRLLSSTLQWLLIIGNGVKIIPSICFLSSFSLICLWRLTFDGVSELVSLFFSFSISNLSSLLFFIVYRRGHMVPRPSYTM